MTLQFTRWYRGDMQLPDWEIGRPLGIPVRVHASWFFVFLFMSWTLATGYLPEALPGLSGERYWGMAAAAALLLFLSVLLHELGHSYVAQRYRIPISQITLFIFGGIAHMGKEPPSPRAEFLIAIAGPIVSLLLGASCLALVFLIDTIAGPSGTQGFLVLGGLLGIVNVQLGIFNLIPGFPLDGGRVLRAGLWAWTSNFHRATGQASTVGLGFGLLLGLVGTGVLAASIAGTLDESWSGNGGWLLFIGAFLFGAAWSARRQVGFRLKLETATVGDVMMKSVVSVPPQLSLQAAVDEYFVPHGAGGFPVLEDGAVIGIIIVEDVQAVPQALWPWRQVRAVMHPAEPGGAVPSHWSVKQALEAMLQRGWDRLVVMEGDKPVGVLTRAVVARFLQLKRSED
ncbi:MAG TPA: site-2 protease family protein [Nitrospira sp.]|nr:site-2 protease family protein [Nitrospira sp.]